MLYGMFRPVMLCSISFCMCMLRSMFRLVRPVILCSVPFRMCIWLRNIAFRPVTLFGYIILRSVPLRIARDRVNVVRLVTLLISLMCSTLGLINCLIAVVL